MYLLIDNWWAVHLFYWCIYELIKTEGALTRMMDGLAQLYNFTYSIFQVNDTTFGPFNGGSGLMHYVITGKCDGLVMFAVTEERLKLLDVSIPYLYMPASFLIPMPEPAISVYAVFESFDVWVWAAYIVSVIITILILFLFNRQIVYKYKQTISNSSAPKTDVMHRDRMKSIFPYVIGLMLHQARYCSSKKLNARIVAAAWCLVSLVTFVMYHATMISYITTYQPKQLISSAEELIRRPDVHMLVQDGYNLQSIFLSAKSGLFKDFGDKLRGYPHSGCSNSECTQMVKSGNHAYFTSVEMSLYTAMRDDYLATGKCNFDILNKIYMELQLIWGVAKHSPYVNEINRGIMIMRETGLLGHWIKEVRPDVRRCLSKAKEKYNSSPETAFAALSLKNLNGAFVILGIGYVAAFFVFIGEQIMFRWMRKQEMKVNESS